MVRRVFLYSSLVFSLLTLAGCATFSKLLGVVADKPKVRLVTVDVKSINTKKMDLDFILEVENPNSFNVTLEDLKYKVRSMDLDLGEGEFQDLINLKGHEKTEVHLPFKLDNDAMAQLIRRYFENPKELKVQLVSNLYLDTAFGKMDMHFEDEKTIAKGLSF